jgi:hypothetical protein
MSCQLPHVVGSSGYSGIFQGSLCPGILPIQYQIFHYNSIDHLIDRLMPWRLLNSCFLLFRKNSEIVDGIISILLYTFSTESKFPLVIKCISLIFSIIMWWYPKAEIF